MHGVAFLLYDALQALSMIASTATSIFRFGELSIARLNLCMQFSITDSEWATMTSNVCSIVTSPLIMNRFPVNNVFLQTGNYTNVISLLGVPYGIFNAGSQKGDHDFLCVL